MSGTAQKCSSGLFGTNRDYEIEALPIFEPVWTDGNRAALPARRTRPNPGPAPLQWVAWGERFNPPEFEFLA